MTAEPNLRWFRPRRWWQRPRWQLITPMDAPSRSLRVPNGFVTDGASVPWLCRWIVSPTGPAMPAAIVHDYLLSLGVRWPTAAKGLRRELGALNLQPWRIALIYRAVVIWGVLTRRR